MNHRFVVILEEVKVIQLLVQILDQKKQVCLL